MQDVSHPTGGATTACVCRLTWLGPAQPSGKKEVYLCLLETQSEVLSAIDLSEISI